jgi:hypothetical protein
MDPDQLRAEIKRVEAKLFATDDPDIAGALELKLSQLKGMVASITPKPESDDQEAVAPLRTLTPKEREEVDRLIRTAHAEKVRGNKTQARELLHQAMQIGAGSALVLEAIADEAIDSKRWRDAKAALDQALKLEPKNIGLEKKHADVVYMIATGGTIDDQLRTALRDPAFIQPHEVLASARAATLLSFFIPGSGQFVLGRPQVGIGYFVTWILMLVWIGIERNDFQGLLGMLGLPSSVSRPNNLTILVPIFVAAGVHLTSIFQCATLAKRSDSKSVKRPVPPVDMKF